MAELKQTLLTPGGIQELEATLPTLIARKREIKERLQSTKTYGDATDLNLWICRQDSSGALTKVGPGVMQLALPTGGMQIYTLSATLENLPVGTYQVGLCGSSNDTEWDLDEFSTTTALVTN